MHVDGYSDHLCGHPTITGKVQRDTNFTEYITQIDGLSNSTSAAKNSTASLQADLDDLGSELQSNTTNVTALAQDCAELGTELRTGDGRVTAAQALQLPKRWHPD